MSPLGLRLWAGFGRGWEWTKVKDLAFQSNLSGKEWKGWHGRGRFFERMDFVRRMIILSIERGWVIGRGPGGLCYDALDERTMLSGDCDGEIEVVYK